MTTTQQDRMMSIKTPLDDDFLLINKLTATETLSELYNFEVELLHEEEDVGELPTVVDVQEILGQNVTITIAQTDGTSRYFNGLVSRFSQGNRDGRFSYYYATIVPDIWRLTQIHQSRIFQQMNVPDILKELFADYEVEWRLTEDYKKRNYCVQYRETDFDFASRLMEEESIFYFFEHAEEAGKLIVGDTPQAHVDCPVKHEIPFFLDVSSQEEFISSIGTWRLDYKLQTGTVTLWDFHFQYPKKKLSAQQPSMVNVGGNQEMEFYDFPGGYARKYDGIDKGGGSQASELSNTETDNTRTAKNRMQELDAQYKTFTGIADCSAMTTGYRFKMLDHPNKDYNIQYTLTSVTHQIEQTPDYITQENVSNAYTNSFTCIPHTIRFSPPRLTPKPVVQGSQTAFVVGNAGEEITTDKYGRVKVQFHWDRDGQLDAGSSCWVRVAQAWAGNRWGMMFIPRIGMEVIVDFLEGDPDQPIITGCVYNEQAMPPYQLPDEKTKMTIKSDSSVGGQGFNELRFEDKKGHEQVFIHGEKDIDVRNKNDRREYVGNDHHFIVHRDRREKIEGNSHKTVEGETFEQYQEDVFITLEKSLNSIIGKDCFWDVDETLAVATKTTELSATDSIGVFGGKVIVKAQQGLTIRCGGNFITIDPSGIYIKGNLVYINSGGAPLDYSETIPPDMVSPKIPDAADDAKPGSKVRLEAASESRKEKRHKEDKKKKSWIKIKLIDEAGKPVPGVRYKVTTPEGRVKGGSLDKEGKAHVKGFDPGTCKVTFPELDGNAWEDA